jgi:hypothetical protein
MISLDDESAQWALILAASNIVAALVARKTDQFADSIFWEQPISGGGTRTALTKQAKAEVDAALAYALRMTER